MKAIGKTTWLIPDMYWPEVTSPGHYVSHEAVCVLNASDEDCTITLDLYYEDREPIKGLQECCKARRTRHIRLDMLRDKAGAPLPRGVAYAAVVSCSVPAVVQYTRLDTTQSDNSIMTTMAYPV